MLDHLMNMGFEVSFKVKEDNVEARVTSPDGHAAHVKIGKNAEEAVILSLLSMVCSLERYLAMANSNEKSYLHELHRHGIVYNLMDEEEVSRMRNVFEQDKIFQAGTDMINARFPKGEA